MITTLEERVTYDRRGFISCGKMENGRPKKLDHFDVSDFAELAQVYPGKPKSLVIYLPHDDWRKCFNDEYALWGGSTRKRTCDGELCTHRVNENVNGAPYEAGMKTTCICTNLAEDDKQRCKYEAVFTAMVADPETLKPIAPVFYAFRTHSPNSGLAIRSELDKLDRVLGRGLFGIPFVITVRMAERKDKAKETFPVWDFRMHEGAILRVAQIGAANSDTWRVGAATDEPVRQIGAGTEPVTTAEDVLIGIDQMHEIHELGRAVYGDAWEESVPKLCAHYSQEKARTLEQLAPDMLQRLLTALHARVSKMTEQPAANEITPTEPAGYVAHEDGLDSPGEKLSF